ncbi:porin family protein [Shewanella sp. OMA3-2]|uniref:porin family protein n=1 Tax=Shewanella sp. OMA3-2 TaxID=2908650 RepID=UPI001F1C235D|nr:porin family protein [Shewanella sp. OMA3-2]UJF20505.1 porin family protein [Shewanella sp. OMA3-2]
MKKTILVAALITAGFLSSSAQAETYNPEVDAQGFYVGADYGFLRVEGDEEFDDNKGAYQVFAGYGLNQYIAVEGSYIDFGRYGNDLANADTDGYSLGLKLGLPVTDNISLYVRGGQLWYKTDYSVLGVSDSTDDEGLFAGVGVSYHVNKNWTVKADYTLYDNDLDIESAADDIDNANFSTDLKFASIGVEYKF